MKRLSDDAVIRVTVGKTEQSGQPSPVSAPACTAAPEQPRLSTREAPSDRI